MKKSYLLGAVCTFLAWTSTSQAVTIDFESLTTSSSTLIGNGSPYYEDGFFVQASSDTGPGILGAEDGWDSNRGSSNGTVTAAAIDDEGSNSATFYLGQADAAPFSLFSIDFGEIVKTGDVDDVVVADSVLVTGNLIGGGTVSSTVDLDLISDGIGGADDFETFLFDSQWSNLWYVKFYATRQVADGTLTYVNFDNIVVSTVPIPPAIWLFGSGLLGLVGMARRKKT